MKDNDLLTYAALAVGGYLLYTKVIKKTAVPVASSVAVPVSANTTVTQSALPAANTTANVSNLVSSIAKLLSPGSSSQPNNNAIPLEAETQIDVPDVSASAVDTDIFKNVAIPYLQRSGYSTSFMDA